MTVAQFKKELKTRLVRYELQLRISKTVSDTRYKHMATALRGVEMIIADIKVKPVKKGKEVTNGR